MNIGRRIELIKKLAWTMARESWMDVDLILSQCGLTTSADRNGDDTDDGRYRYCLQVLRLVTDDILRDLDTYLHGPTDASPDDAPWRTSGLRVFLSHVSRQRAYAGELKAQLTRHGIEGFVAHEDIEPNKEWQRVIEAALRSCDACVALLHRAFPASKWCDQELGFAICRNVPVIPVSVDRQPYGFLGKVQSLPGTDLPPSALAHLITRALSRDPRTATTLARRALTLGPDLTP